MCAQGWPKTPFIHFILQKVSLGINRSDYLMDLDSEGGQHIKQVEINTMYSAGATAGCCISACHK